MIQKQITSPRQATAIVSQIQQTKVHVVFPDPALKNGLVDQGTTLTHHGNELCQTLVISPLVESSKGLPVLKHLTGNLERAATKHLTHVVLISSAQAYGMTSSNPGLIKELFAVREENQDLLAKTWTECERIATQFTERRGATLTILRTCTIASDSINDPLNRMLASKFATSVTGRLPSIQFLSLFDLARAINIVVENPTSGMFNVAPDDAIPIKRAFAITRTKRLPLPAWLHTVSRSAQNSRKFCWTTSNQSFKRTFDFEFEHSSESALMDRCGREGETPIDKPVFHDPFGMDPDYINKCGLGRFRLCEKYYWRIEHKGLKHIPTSGGAVLAGSHRGFMPFDGVMMVHLLNQYCSRVPRFLIHPALVKFGHLDGFLKRIGGVLANQDNANWVLDRNEILAVFPEGVRGAFKKYDKDVYLLGSFGRNDFVKVAVQHQVPIVPFVSIGPAESFPILKKFNWKWWKRTTGWPSFPVTPTWPLLPVPLPSKWHFQILEQVCPKEFGVDSLDDKQGVRDLSQHVRGQMQSALDEMKSNRRSFFFGSVLKRQLALVEQD